MPARSPKPFLDTTSPLCFAHRGGAALWPENTLVAFRGALEHGIRYLETDLHATRDGVLVVHHDETVDRTTDGRGVLRHYSLAELKQLDAGYRFERNGEYPFRAQGIAIPTLEELLEQCPEARFNVEIKQREPDIVEQFWRFIDARGLHERFLVAAEHDPLVRRFRELSRGTVATSSGRKESTAFFFASRARLERLLPIAYDAMQVPVKARLGPREVTVVDARFVRAAHRRGVQVHVWTVDAPEEMRRLLALGVDGLMSDRPDRLAELDKLGHAPGA